MLKILRITLPLLLLCFALPFSASAQTMPTEENYRWVEVASGFDNPLGITNAGDDRLFGIEQFGRIWVIEDGVELDEPFLDISDQIPAAVFSGGYSEQGLLGLAFHPHYQDNG